MGDLQSPTYVKRTAHMFNSKYSSQLNGSSSPGDPIKENRNPSYLNVSRSVSGYSCLSYNNGVTTSTTNGSSSCTNGTSPYSHKYVSPTSTKVKTEFTIKVNQQPQVVRHHHHRMNEDDNEAMNNGDGRLIRSPTSPNKSKYHDDESEETSEVDGTYVPSHGKSFIMQRIERLYGSEAVQSASVFSKSSVNKGGSATTTTLKCETVLYSPSKGKERVIPIQIEDDVGKVDEVDRSAVSLESCPGNHRLHTINLDAGDKQMIVTSAKIKNGVHNDDNRPLTSPSPTKKSQPLYDAASLDVTNSVVDIKTDKANDNVESKPVAASVTDNLLTSEDSVNRSSSLSPSTMPSGNEGVKNGTYFLNEMNLTKKRLAEYTAKFGKEVEEIDQSSERAGNILSAVGKANLLMKKKFKQFEELCNLNLQKDVGDNPVTTNGDLEGFWDMVMIQVEQVYALFQKLEGIEPADSKDVPDKAKAKAGGSPRKVASTKGAKPAVSKSQSSEAAKARDESRRKMLAEKRRMMKNQAQAETGTTDQEEVVIFAPETN